MPFKPGNIFTSIKRRFAKKSPKIDDDANKGEPERGHWGHFTEFYLATLGYAVGIGEITRFPYLCTRNGGGAFLIPFIIAMFAAGVPLFYLEVALGQFSGLSPLTMWSLCPIFKGVGYACVLLSGIVGIYYNMLLTWCIFYLVKSFAYDVPWRGCDNSWNSERCFDPFSTSLCSSNTTGNLTTYLNSSNCTVAPKDFLLPSEDFLNNVVLGVKNDGTGIDSLGSLHWHLVLSLLTAWLAVFFCQMRGIKTSGKVVYVTATVPYLLLTALLVRGVTLDGAGDGLIYYLKPNFSTLLTPNVWVEASLQMFYSLGPSWGGLITMASYNKFHHRVDIESFAVPLSDLFTALYGGFAIFSVLGFMAKHTKLPIERFSASGPILAFVVYPQAIAEMPFSPIWSICFFLTLLTLGIDSQFGFTDPVICGLCDLFPKLRNYKTLVTGSVTTICFLLGLPFCTENGIYLYTLIEWYSASLTVTVVAFLEIIAVAYIYGVNRFSSDIKLMLGSEPNVVWKFCWLVLTPLLVGALLFIGLVNLSAPTYHGYQYPVWAIVTGWVVALVSFAPIPGFAIYAVITSPQKTFCKKLSSVFLPTEDWVPANKEIVEMYRATYYYKNPDDNGENSGENDSLFKCWILTWTARLFGTCVNKSPGNTNVNTSQDSVKVRIDSNDEQSVPLNSKKKTDRKHCGHRNVKDEFNNNNVLIDTAL